MIFIMSGQSEEHHPDACRFLPSKKRESKDEVVVNALPKIQPFDEDYYQTDHANRGVALIFNHYAFDNGELQKREGTELDRDLAIETFNNLGFTTIVHNDLKLGGIEDALEEVAEMDHKDNDCLVVLVMTHGDDDKLHARDEVYNHATLWEPFAGDKCSTLLGKPKLFFIQACRGTGTDAGVKYRLEFDGSLNTRPLTLKIPKMADFLIMYGTPVGNYCFRSPTTGSWFIQTLCRQLAMKAKDTELHAILVLVNREMAFTYMSNVPNNRNLHEMTQVGQIVSSLTRLLHFNRKTQHV